MNLVKIIKNKYFNTGLNLKTDSTISTDLSQVQSLLELCPMHKKTPLNSYEKLAKNLNISELWIKNEGERMGLGSFKALGASYVIASHAAREKNKFKQNVQWSSVLSKKVYVTASAGNHGLSVAVGAKLFGAKAVIFLSENVPKAFAKKLEDKGADVIIEGHTYEQSQDAAIKKSKENNWILLSDSTWEGYEDAKDVMEGYLMSPFEAFEEFPGKPTHIFLQAGVGGFAAAVAALARKTYLSYPKIIIVEPTEAPALQASIENGFLTEVNGDVSEMGRLDCKVPSLLALSDLSLTANYFVTLSDDYVQQTLDDLDQEGLTTTPSGGAGYACLKYLRKTKEIELNNDSKVLIFISELDF